MRKNNAKPKSFPNFFRSFTFHGAWNDFNSDHIFVHLIWLLEGFSDNSSTFDVLASCSFSPYFMKKKTRMITIEKKDRVNYSKVHIYFKKATNFCKTSTVLCSASQIYGGDFAKFGGLYLSRLWNLFLEKSWEFESGQQK